MKYDDIFALTAIKVLLLGLYRYGIAVTTIFVLLYCGFGHSYEYDYSGQKFLRGNHNFCQFEAQVLLSQLNSDLPVRAILFWKYTLTFVSGDIRYFSHNITILFSSV